MEVYATYLIHLNPHVNTTASYEAKLRGTHAALTEYSNAYDNHLHVKM